MKKLPLLIALFAALFLAGCGAKRSQAYYDQPSQVLSVNYDGSYVIRVQVRARNAPMTFAHAQRKAVQEGIFDGVKAGSSSISDLKPLCFDMNAREKYESYFEVFFRDHGEWENYVSIKGQRILTNDYQRTFSQTVSTMNVTVDRAALKKKLQADGIIPKEGRY
jgi:hypothetical protein